MDKLQCLKQLARGIAEQYGNNCEVVIHDLLASPLENSVVHIENGHVSCRHIGDGPSHVVLDATGKPASECSDRHGYLTRTQDGRILKSSTIYICNDSDSIRYIFCINHDITGLLAVESAIHSLTHTPLETKDPERIPQNVNDLLDDLIEQSVIAVGKPAALMTKDEKVAAIQFLNKAGAFLITKSGDKVASYFAISKYTLYNYIDIKNSGK